jgi:hypothetical protein
MKKVPPLSCSQRGVVAAASAQTSAPAQSGAQQAAMPELKQGDINLQKLNEA